MKLFVSYARVDKPLCKQVVEGLSHVHEVWYDRRLHAGMDWWNEIQEKLDWCEGFVYLLSPESVKSKYCQKEFAIAANSAKHIFPVLIQARTEIPDSLSHIQYANLSEGMEDMITLMNAIAIAERREYQRRLQTKPKPKPVPKQPSQPPQPTSSPSQALAEAADAMEGENFDNAVFVIKQALEEKPVGRIGRMLKALLKEAETALERQTYLREAEREYTPIRHLVERDATRKIGCAEFQEFQQDFPDYDPDNIADQCAEIVAPEPDSPLDTPSTSSKVLEILPPPFDWIEIPKKGYSIAKYPVTNAQYRKFIEAGGYTTQKWWTDAGWQQKQSDSWTEPRYWDNSKFNGDNQPVVGVSWFEAVAFCLWLSDTTGEKIMLPTEDQWQYAAQGDDGRTYPWGNDWDGSLCQNRVGDNNPDRTSPVTQYEGKGDSPFGVVDMAGNVWEWCLTDYNEKTNDFNSPANRRVLRGGSWRHGGTDGFRCGGP